LCDLRSVQVGIVSQSELDEMNKQLRKDLPDLTSSEFLHSANTSFHPAASGEGAEYDIGVGFFQTLRPLSRSEYERELVPFLVKLACSDVFLASGIAMDSALLVVWRDDRGSEVASALLKEQSDGKCPVLEDLRDDIKAVLEQAAGGKGH
jgi:hypothetical protein